MLYIKVDENRVVFVSEYWILIPLMIAISIAIIVKVKKNRAKKKLKSEQLKKKCKQRKIFYIATGNIISALQIRAGENLLAYLVENYIEIEHPNCLVGKGRWYVNNERLRKIAYSLFRSKAKNGVIYITKMALCHLVKMYGLGLSTLPIPVPDFIGITEWYQLVRKIISVGCLGIPVPMLILAKGPASVILSLAIWGFGIVAMAYVKDPGFLLIPTNIISTPVYSINHRIPDQPDLVSVDLESVSRREITMLKFSTGYECSLPEQIMYNPKCSLRHSEIADITANANIHLNYDEVVNIQNITKLTTVEFSDKFEISSSLKSPKPTTNFRLRGTKRFKNPGKTPNFLEKFGDPEFISDTEQWDITIPTPQDAIRIQDGEL
jgi:hypothetical protein